MFVYNLKLNGSKIYKILLVIVSLFVMVLCGIVAYKLYKASFKVNDETTKNNIIELSDDNYTTFLKEVHANLDNYIGLKIKYTGYVYRVYDLDINQFVLARNMIISSNLNTVVVGFLCNYEDANSLKNNTWIEIEATITKGIYHGDMPILKINNLKKIDRPLNELVNPPDNSYIPISTVL